MIEIVYVDWNGYFSARCKVDPKKLNTSDFLGKTKSGIRKYRMPILKMFKEREIKFKTDND